MKRLSLLVVAALTALVTWAQTLEVSEKGVVWQFAATQWSNQPFAFEQQGELLHFPVLNTNFTTTEVDYVEVNEKVVVPKSVVIDVAAVGTTRPVFIVDGALRPYLTLTCNNRIVTVVASDALKEEITFRLTGTNADAAICLRGSTKCIVQLDNLNLTSSTAAPLWIDNGKRIDLVVMGGTENTLTDAAANPQKAALFIKGHVEMKGSGKLHLTGNARHAYASNEYTWIRENFGALTVHSAAADGMHVRQYLRMDGGVVRIDKALGDGIDVENTTNDDGTIKSDEHNGQVFINGGELHLAVAAADVKGIKSDSDFALNGGVVNAAVSGDGSKGISVGGNFVVAQTTNEAPQIRMMVTGTTYHPKQDDESKTRGVKVRGNFTFDGGTISISATGKKSKAISVDGKYTYVRGTIDCVVDAAQ